MGSSRSLPRELLLAASRVDTAEPELVRLFACTERAGLLQTFEGLADAHGVSALVWVRLNQVDGVDADRCASLVHARDAAHARQLHAVRTIRAVTDALQAPFVVFKGPALTRWYDEPAVRTYSDLDVLVRRSDFGPSFQRLADAGFVELSSNWRGFLKHQVAEVPLGHGVTCVDLHWGLIAMGGRRCQFSLDEDVMMSRAQPITLNGSEVRTFDDVDTLLHLCVSSGLDGGRRLLQLVDIDRVVRRAEIDWAAFCERARHGRVRALCSAVLGRCRRLLGTPAQDAILDALSPFRGWAHLHAAIGERRVRVPRLAGGVGSGHLVSAGRDTLPATALAVLSSTGEVARVRLGGRDFTDAGGELDWQASSPTVAADRQRYLHWVEGG